MGLLTDRRETVMAPGFEYRLLGPVEVEHDGVAVPIRGAKQRALLAALLADANRVVSGERLIAWIWESAPPAKALGALHNQVARLRQVLTKQAGPDADPITTHADGYLITLDGQDFDLHRFNIWTQSADAAAAADRLQDALMAYDQALAEWHGEPLSGIRSESLRLGLGSALTERHLTVIEARLDTVLRLGQHRPALAELAELTAAHPLREHFWEQYMLALYRCGRQGDALTTYRGVSALLAEELGIEPGAGLRKLHQRILAADPALVLEQARQPAAPAAHPAHTVPRQLPASIRHFSGRSAELKIINELLTEVAAGGPVVIAAIGGTAGIGKTALALHWAHLHADWFPDGQLYVNLRGFDPSDTPMPTSDAIRRLLDALGVPVQRIPTDPDEQAGLYRSVLAGRRMLVLLDNARDAEQVRPLLPASPGTLVLVTSRNQLGTLIALDGAVPLTLDPLTHDEALILLTRRLGHERVHAEDHATSKLIDLCARLPLALNIAAARVALQPARALSACVDELRDARHRLDSLAMKAERRMCVRSSSGPTASWIPRQAGCSDCWACTPAPTPACRPRPA
jgi:DNA-binding SARP family transcriptional activator